MLRKLILICSILLLPCSFAFADFVSGDFTMAGYFKNEVSVGLDTFNEVTKLKNIFGLSMEYKLNADAAFFVSTKYWYDSVYSLYDKLDSAQYYMQHIQRNDWLRDCYFDYAVGPWFFRMGKQQVSWGQGDIPILDKVNPVDFTEFGLADAVDLRIPLWMANINYSPKLNSNLQLLIIPDFEQTTGAPPNAAFAFRSYRNFLAFKEYWEATGNGLDTNIYYPSTKPENFKIGVQWQDRIADWDYTLNYLYGYDYLARTYLDSQDFIDPPPPPITIQLNYGRRFKLVQMVGGSFNHSFTEEGLLKGVTLKGDAAVYFNEPTYYGDTTSRGVNRWDNVFWLMGVDKAIFTNWQVSFQFAQYILQDAKPGVDAPPPPFGTGLPYITLNSFTNGPQDQVENIFSLRVATDFMNERLKPEILWSFTDDNQGRVSPKVTYELKDNLWLTAGVHYFYGSELDSSGQFKDYSQFYTSVKFTF
jgi:hypothetical protein